MLTKSLKLIFGRLLYYYNILTIIFKAPTVHNSCIFLLSHFCTLSFSYCPMTDSAIISTDGEMMNFLVLDGKHGGVDLHIVAACTEQIG